MKHYLSAVIFNSLMLFFFLFPHSVSAADCRSVCQYDNGNPLSISSCRGEFGEVTLRGSTDGVSANLTIVTELIDETEKEFCLVMDSKQIGGINSVDNPSKQCTLISMDPSEYSKIISLNPGSQGRHSFVLFSSAGLENSSSCSNPVSLSFNSSTLPSSTPTPTPQIGCSSTLGSPCLSPDLGSSCSSTIDTSRGTTGNCTPICEGFKCAASLSGGRIEKDESSDIDLDSIEAALDQATSGAVGGNCAIGGVEFTGQGDFDYTTSITENAPNALMKLWKGISSKVTTFATSAFKSMKLVQDVANPNSFCPIGDAVTVFRSEEGDIISRDDIIAEYRGYTDSGDFDPSVSIFSQLSEADLGDLSDAERIALAGDLMTRTSSQSIAEKTQSFTNIRALLGKATISCTCDTPQITVQGQATEIEDLNRKTCSAMYGGGVSDTAYDECLKVTKSLAEECSQVFDTSNTGAKRASAVLKCLNDNIGYCTNLSPSLSQNCLNAQRRAMRATKVLCKPLSDTMFASNAPVEPDKPSEFDRCVACHTLEKGVWTSFGCVYSDFSDTLTKVIFPIAIGFGGLIALSCIIYAAFIMQTSAGSPEKVKKAQELITSCITGLIVIIFSIVILRIIGVDILKIPWIS